MKQKILELAKQFGIREFVSTQYELGFPHQDLFGAFDAISCFEIVDSIAEQATNEWESRTDEYWQNMSLDGNIVGIVTNNPYDGLAQASRGIAEPILFFLNDNHPARKGFTAPADEYNFPLEQELEIIAANRTKAQDVIVIEGLSLYERGCNRPIEGWNFSPYTSSEFIERIFAKTHNIERNYSGIGYAFLTPKPQETIEIKPKKSRKADAKEDIPPMPMDEVSDSLTSDEQE